MSLTVYTSRDKVPDHIHVVDNNDVYFIGYSDIPDDTVTSQILKDVDGVRRVSDNSFESKFAKGMSLSKDMLSTGAKTLLNITQHPNKCFSTIDCGQNALMCLKHLTTGYALVEICYVPCVDDPKCDIVVDGKLFTDFNEAVDCISHGGYYEED